MKILLLSDTHSYVDQSIINYVLEADEVWHCGDFGSMEVIETIKQYKPLRGVYGNIDDTQIRSHFKEINHFQCQGLEVLMIHIGGYPNRYTPKAKKAIEEIIKKTQSQAGLKLFISGHSHILKVMYDKKYQLLHLNPGAAGKYGQQKVRTMMRFEIINTEIKNLEIIELSKHNSI